MISEEEFKSIPNEQKVIMSRAMLGHATEKVEKIVDSLSSSSLKRVLKIVSHTHLADALLDKNINFNLDEKEQTLIDSIFALQETVFGHQALLQSIKGEEENPENSGLEQTDLTTSLEENNNE